MQILLNTAVRRISHVLASDLRVPSFKIGTLIDYLLAPGSFTPATKISFRGPRFHETRQRIWTVIGELKRISVPDVSDTVTLVPLGR